MSVVLSTRAAAKRCGVSAETIRRWIKDKGLPAYNTELGLKIRIRLADLEAFAARHNIYLISGETSSGAGPNPAPDECVTSKWDSSCPVPGQLTGDL